MAGEAGKATAVGITAGAAALGGLLMKTTQSLDRIDKLSQKIGMSRREFQKWEYTLSQNGISIEVLQGGFKAMTNAVDQLSNGNKQAVSNFEKLGLSADELRGKTRDEIFNVIIEELQKMPDTVERAALANDLLGRSASELGPLLNQTSESTQALKNRAEELGLVMSDETIDAGVVFGDTLDDVKATLGAAAIQIGSEFIPKLQQLLDWVMSKMPQIQQFFSVAFNAIGAVLTWVADNIRWLIPLLAAMLSGFVAFKVISTVTKLFLLFKGIIGSTTGVVAIFNAVLAANPIGMISLAIGALIGAILLLWTHWDRISSALMGSFRAVSNAFSGMWNFVTGGGSGNRQPTTPKPLPRLATGGIAFGNTLANVGEYPGARSNPEVIAPLDKLRDLLPSQEIDYKRLGRELAQSISGMKVVLGENEVGEFVDMRFAKGVFNV